MNEAQSIGRETTARGTDFKRIKNPTSTTPFLKLQELQTKPEGMKDQAPSDSSALVVFFNHLFEPWLDKKFGDIEIRAFRGKLTKQTFVDSEIEAAKISLELSGKGFDVFSGVNLRLGEDGTKNGVKFLTSFHVDIDYGSDGHKKPSTHKTYDDALQAINSLPLRPSLVIHSGRGFQGYWMLSEAVDVLKTGIKKLESINGNLSKTLGGDQGTQDISRVLRVPGTFNLKIPDNPRAVSVIQNNGPRYTLKDFEAYTVDEKTKEITPQSETVWDGNLSALRINYATKAVIQNGVPEGQRSEAGFSVICTMLKAGYSNEDIFAIFGKYPIGDKYREKGTGKDRWLHDEIERARSFASTREVSKGTP
ncbi:MAG: hypothetical protein L7F78_12875, partial [Syntrophales bacterium LBB04]|nr:hypothetical protein [Syntrophales bacterium LBB04]